MSDLRDKELEEILNGARDDRAIFIKSLVLHLAKNMDYKLYEKLLAWRDQAVKEARMQELEKLHRFQGKGLPPRDYDNETDELIDERLSELSDE